MSTWPPRLCQRIKCGGGKLLVLCRHDQPHEPSPYPDLNMHQPVFCCGCVEIGRQLRRSVEAGSRRSADDDDEGTKCSSHRDLSGQRDMGEKGCNCVVLPSPQQPTHTIGPELCFDAVMVFAACDLNGQQRDSAIKVCGPSVCLASGGGAAQAFPPPSLTLQAVASLRKLQRVCSWSPDHPQIQLTDIEFSTIIALPVPLSPPLRTTSGKSTVLQTVPPLISRLNSI